MAITKTLGTLTTPVPSIQTQTQTAFSENADNAFIYLRDLAPDINTFTTQANTLQTDVNAKQVTASSAATTATDQATASSNSATASATSETNSATSASASATSAGQSEASRLYADKLFLGDFATAPTLDNQGAALQSGAVYLNTSSTPSSLWSFDGADWAQGISAVAGVSSLNGEVGDVTLAQLIDDAQTTTNLTWSSSFIDGKFTALNGWTPISTSSTLTANTKYSVDFGSSPLTLTLPITPAVNDFVEFYKSAGASLDSIIARNGSTIMGLTEDLTIDTEINSLKLIYNGTDWRLS